jgi:ABC-2 type transport system permease protein
VEFNAIYVIVAREFKKFIRERSRLVSAIARPLVWLFFVGAGLSRLVQPVEGVSYTQFMFPGILGLTILFSSIFSSISIIWDKEFGFLKEILVAPVSRFSIVIGKALSGTVVSTIQAVIILLLFPFLGIKLGILNIIAVVILCAMVSFSISAFGIVLATFYESYESFSVIMNFIVMPMFFLSGAMYPVKQGFLKGSNSVHNLPERIIEMISHIPSKEATPKATKPRIDMPYMVGPTPVACIIAELSSMALIIMANAILLLERSISLMNCSKPV